MNRRNFIKSALKAATGFMILPSAVTYARSWKPTTSQWLIVREIDGWFKDDDLYIKRPLLTWYWGAHRVSLYEIGSQVRPWRNPMSNATASNGAETPGL